VTFPSNTGTKSDDLAGAWELARRTAGGMKSVAQSTRNQSAASTLTGSSIINVTAGFAAAKTILQRVAAVPGIGAYAQNQVNDPTLVIGTEFTAMVNALTSCIDWVVANYPKDGSGFLLVQTILPSGLTQERIFTAAATAGLRVQLDALIAAID
jgi:hypothetical protein